MSSKNVNLSSGEKGGNDRSRSPIRHSTGLPSRPSRRIASPPGNAVNEPNASRTFAGLASKPSRRISPGLTSHPSMISALRSRSGLSSDPDLPKDEEREILDEVTDATKSGTVKSVAAKALAPPLDPDRVMEIAKTRELSMFPGISPTTLEDAQAAVNDDQTTGATKTGMEIAKTRELAMFPGTSPTNSADAPATGANGNQATGATKTGTDTDPDRVMEIAKRRELAMFPGTSSTTLADAHAAANDDLDTGSDDLHTGSAKKSTSTDTVWATRSQPGAQAVSGIGGSGSIMATAQSEDLVMIHESSNDRAAATQSLVAAELVDEENRRNLSVYQAEALSYRQSADNFIDAAFKIACCCFPKLHHTSYRTKKALCLLVGALIVIGSIVAINFAVVASKESTEPQRNTTDKPTETKRPALERIIERGILKCCISEEIGFGVLNEGTGRWEGFEVDLCRAVAAAILGDPDRIELTPVTAVSRFPLLSNGTFDLLARSTTHTMERDVHEQKTGRGYSFTVPYLYDGLRFGGLPFFVECADKLQATGECEGLLVCVPEGTTHFDIISGLLPSRNIVVVDSTSDFSDSLHTGRCNVISGEQLPIFEVVIRQQGDYTGDYVVGKNVFSKEPLAIVTRDDDFNFFKLVNSVFQSLLVAESRGIKQATAAAIGRTQLFGEGFEDLFVNAISAVGNYGEIYERHLEAIVPRQGLNFVNMEGTTGLIYSHPFGKAWNAGPGPMVNGTLAGIKDRGELLCGVLLHPESGGERDYGMGKDYCRALAAGNSVSVRFVELSGADVAFDALKDKDVDVVTGASVTLSGGGHIFSQPYFYLPLTGMEDESFRFGEALALVTRLDDVQWSDFVYWTVAATFYAEEEGVPISNANDMPLVELFGPDYIRMFRDAILTVGNYGDIYERNAGLVVPRSGRNLVNANPSGPQLYPPLLQ